MPCRAVRRPSIVLRQRCEASATPSYGNPDRGGESAPLWGVCMEQEGARWGYRGFSSLIRRC